MLIIRPTRPWASYVAASLACLAMAAAGIALAQESQNQGSKQNNEQQQRIREQQQRQQEQQQRQQEQQQREREQQQRQREQSDAERSAQPNRDQEVRPWPSPNREQLGEDSQRGNDRDEIASERGRSQQGASLGVNLGASDEGVAIVRVQPGSPAERMGVRVRDRVTHINGERIRAIADFISRIRSMDPGNQIELTIVRDQNERTLRGELASLASSEEFNREREFSRNVDPSSSRFSWSDEGRENWQRGRDNRQTSFEDDASRPRSGDVNERLSRIEEQIDRLAQAIDDLRATIGDTRRSDRPESRSQSETQANYDERQYNRPRSINSYDRWNAEENRFRQGDISGARQRSQEAQRQRQDQQRNAAERQRDQSDEQSRQSDRERSQSSRERSSTERSSTERPSTERSGSDRSKNADEPNSPNDKTNNPR